MIAGLSAATPLFVGPSAFFIGLLLLLFLGLVLVRVVIGLAWRLLLVVAVVLGVFWLAGALGTGGFGGAPPGLR